jgi:hypothetical protein
MRATSLSALTTMIARVAASCKSIDDDAPGLIGYTHCHFGSFFVSVLRLYL